MINEGNGVQEECLSTALCMGLQRDFPISLFQVRAAAAELMAKFDTFVSFSPGCRFGEGLEDLLPNSIQLNAMSSQSKEPSTCTGCLLRDVPTGTPTCCRAKSTHS